jgi:hypothetical protein
VNLRVLEAWILAIPLVFGLGHQDELAKDRARFERETNPVHRAKLLVRLGRAEFEQIEKQVADNNITEALDDLREYEKEADSVSKALDAAGVNAEKHSAGFKELQISVREAVRRLNDLMVGLSGDDQKPFLEVRDNLDALNAHLIDELFPHETGAKLGSGKKKD